MTSYFFLWSRTYITHLTHCCCQYSYIKAFRVTSCTTIFAIIYFSIALLKISWNQTNKQELIWVGDPTRKQMVFSKCYSLRKAYWYKGAVYKGISLEKQLSVWIAWVEKWFSEPEGEKQVETLLWEEPGPSVGLIPARSQDGDWHSLYGPIFWTRELTEEGTENLWKQILNRILFSMWLYVYAHRHAHIGQRSFLGAIPQAICLDFWEMVSYWLA